MSIVRGSNMVDTGCMFTITDVSSVSAGVSKITGIYSPISYPPTCTSCPGIPIGTFFEVNKDGVLLDTYQVTTSLCRQMQITIGGPANGTYTYNSYDPTGKFLETASLVVGTSPQTCVLMTRPLVTTSTPTTTEGGQFTFTSISMGGVMTGDGMRHVVKLGNIQIFDSGVGQSASITKTITLPSTVVASGYQLTTTVSDGCVTNGVKTPQTMTSQTFYVIITARAPPPPGDITISSLSWDTPDSATSKIKFTLTTTGSGLVSTYVDGSLDYVYLYIPGTGSDKTLFSYATNASHNICFGTVCGTIQSVACPLMIRPIISPTSMTATVGGQLTFTTTSIGGTTTKDGMRHVVKLGNTVIYDSGVGQATSITKTVTLPPSITAGSYQLTTTVSDGCLPTHQTMISGSVTINVTGTAACTLMIRPIISPTSMTATVGGQLTFTTTSIGGVLTGDAMRHVVKLGDVVIYDSGIRQATSITKTVTLPPSITAGSYPLTTTVSDGCLPTHQTMTSGSVTINVTGMSTSVIVNSVSWQTPTSSTSMITVNLTFSTTVTTQLNVDSILDSSRTFTGSGTINIVTSKYYATNTQHPVCIGTSCKTLPPAGTSSCPLMIRPIISPTSMTATVGGQLTFTTTSVGGTMTGDGMHHVVKLGNVVIFDSGVGQATSITKTVTLPNTITAGSYQLTTTVSDGCITNGVKTPQTMTSGSVTINVTGTSSCPTLTTSLTI